MGFKFKETKLTIVIEGHNFVLDVGSIEAIENVAKLKDAMPSVEAPVPNDPTGIRSLCATIGQNLNAILGDGAYERIFAGREINLVDHISLAAYVMVKINDFTSVQNAKAFVGDYAAPTITDEPAGNA